MNVALYCRTLRVEYIPFLQKILDLLARHDFGVYVYRNFFEQVWKEIKSRTAVVTFQSFEDIKGRIDYIFSMGGDGTLLDTLAFVRDQGTPVVGINIGRLGFLANIGTDDIETCIESIHSGSYVLDKRSLLQLEGNRPLFGDLRHALNDVTIHKKDTSAMIVIHTYINGEFLNSYFADGLIIATPTGSTAYSLSCGGPIVIPTAENFVITPVSPHNLNVRPIVVSDSSVISFEVEGRNEQFFCTLDARTESVDTTVQLAVRKSPFTMNLLRLSDQHFQETLRRKLMWGADVRM